jgi:hypothetical protein
MMRSLALLLVLYLTFYVSLGPSLVRAEEDDHEGHGHEGK